MRKGDVHCSTGNTIISIFFLFPLPSCRDLARSLIEIEIVSRRLGDGGDFPEVGAEQFCL